ncbi:hypothetical protein [Mucilaginibacter sp. L3T2-6]|uniref:hypothetical protein n=1 Tax=Mucilaginibacter sp. L3T2-6 TaxID=3062491 RepID=UPI00267710F3|nr:hypothetical protein [Mucilaginibacter sp. L3T2-6]MDO3644839.1 hypothetical protein [Mucilaginibacter sp. L3T2-6]MDV6217267.1 hypothetical protein [Mucilaginibacter sp. L3T2-6]
MKKLKNSLLIFCLAIAIFACSKHKDIPSYTVSKVIKTDTLTTVNVHIANRINRSDLLLIAGKVKEDSSQIKNLKVSFLLPGNSEISAGDNSYYASARFIEAGKAALSDTVKDYNGNYLRLEIFGVNKEQASHLLGMKPQEISGKNVLGKFIDDYNHTVIIPFSDPKDPKKEVYIIELDSAANVVSKTIPQIVRDGDADKWIVTQHGDYMTLKDSVLTQFGADGLGMPFNSIKAGI